MVAALALKKDNSSIPLKRLCNFADRAEPRQFHIARRPKMKGTPQDKKRKQAKGALGSGPANLQRMNRKQRRDWARKIQADDISLEIMHPDAAGIDIGNECHYVAVPSKRDPEQSVRRFGCVTAELKEMAEWLKQCGIRTVAMQSTGSVLCRLSEFQTQEAWLHDRLRLIFSPVPIDAAPSLA
jgi:hypothetical protein